MVYIAHKEGLNFPESQFPPLHTEKRMSHSQSIFEPSIDSCSIPLVIILWSSGLPSLNPWMPRTSILVIPFAWVMLPEILLRLNILW